MSSSKNSFSQKIDKINISLLKIFNQISFENTFKIGILSLQQ